MTTETAVEHVIYMLNPNMPQAVESLKATDSLLLKICTCEQGAFHHEYMPELLTDSFL